MKIKAPLRFCIGILFSLFCVLHSGVAQNRSRAFNSFFAGYTTAGPLVSINYDRIVHLSPRLSTSFSIGIAAARNTFGLPLGIQLFQGQHNAHIEYGFVFLPYIEKVQYLFQAGNRADKKGYLIPSIGYRYQRPAGGLFFRIAASPVIALDPRSDNFWKMDGKLLPGCLIGAGFSF